MRLKFYFETAISRFSSVIPSAPRRDSHDTTTRELTDGYGISYGKRFSPYIVFLKWQRQQFHCETVIWPARETLSMWAALPAIHTMKERPR